MAVLVTGNRGYIGSVLTEVLVERGYDVAGLDTGYYADCCLVPCSAKIRQMTRDVREVSRDDLKGIDSIIHLAALSNDPLGEISPEVTEDINLNATVRMAHLAKTGGVKRFVYASSQSMYGVSKTGEELGEDDSEKNPLTSYARTKWQAEMELKKLGSKQFCVTCFRPSTVFGSSPSMRCDIVFNNLVACAYTTGRIGIKSDGSPWRSVVHVRDVSSAFIAGLEAPEEIVANESFNVGIRNGNYRVIDLAEAARRAVPGSELEFTGEHGNDARTYRVSIKKIMTVLGDYYNPSWDLDKGGRELVECFKRIQLKEEMFRGRMCNRLEQLKYLASSRRVGNQLYWQG